MKIDYGSEIVEHLPVSQEPIPPEDFAKIAPLLDEGTEVVYSLRKYIIIMILFIVLSFSWVDQIILKFVPSLTNFSYLVVILKGALFALGLYLIDNLKLITQNK